VIFKIILATSSGRLRRATQWLLFHMQVSGQKYKALFIKGKIFPDGMVRCTL
jgi:hypothetical protein